MESTWRDSWCDSSDAALAKVCSVRRQRDRTSAVRSASPAKKRAIPSYTWALVPRQVLAVTSSRAQAQIAASGLKSGLYAGRRSSRTARSGVAK